MDQATTQRIQGARRILESLFSNTEERIARVQHGNHQIHVTDQTLRVAMQSNQLFAEYQPLISPKTGSVQGVEALIRWNHPDVGLISPVAFVPAAEQLGCLVEMDLWMMYQACSAVKKAGTPRLHVGVNVSAQHLLRRGFVDDVNAVLSDVRLPPEQLVIEITESALMEDIDTARDILHTLRSRGVKFAIDDFGTGYSSLSYLKDLPVDMLKIDRSFISSIPSDQKGTAIVEIIAILGRRLGLSVTAEGVETPQQLEFVRDHCDMVQGYIYSRPTSLEHIVGRFKLTSDPPSSDGTSG
ncbi:putative bifunctional diguanylate cyclase/phosphodiesterase [Alicyclobacillus sp. ALC3]|uniref:putative bifunctional diguanylate cyclase/phosphodiesterase n=1 Tax=Alicyclobacillus sp. ALC3 TaxID=2796143 RepID=UPI00237866E6|nr:EAL domain-containing protein [Alicyclobacillus sp. ALC3]WDL97924.1 EAL domain-containing protein [Alicyclobacillus sp. ALC3]